MGQRIIMRVVTSLVDQIRIPIRQAKISRLSFRFTDDNKHLRLNITCLPWLAPC